MARESWEVPFLAVPEEVGALRRILRLHLTHWGLPEVVESAELCVSELVANVITHVGEGVPTTFRLGIRDTCVRIEVGDPDARSLPAPVAAGIDAEHGRGLALLDAVADRWGVVLREDCKITWCELATGLGMPTGHTGGRRVDRGEVVIGHYKDTVNPEVVSPLLGVALAEEAAVDVIADLLHWIRAHGRDPDAVLERAQAHYETTLGGSG
ncbi:ATP-binding protein [Streptomyces typhae]|uniref:ATP-binding protein n=1 Tax=Streptomyces typhae TaxID=2681492 RepID=UPI0031B63122